MNEAARAPRAVEVRRAMANDIAALVPMLCRAFDTDPFYRWLIPESDAGAARLTGIFQLILTTMSDRLSETFTMEHRAGMAMWLPPGKHQLSLWQQAQLLPDFARVLGWRNIPRGLRIMAHMDALHARFAPEHHFYLSVLGVDPTLQRQGLGARLLAPMLDRCDEQRHVVYLETAREQNVRFYERQGFRIRSKATHAEFPTFWSMTRDPR